MDFSLNSSLVLALAVGLWLLWVVPYLLGGRSTSAGSSANGRRRPPAPARQAAASRQRTVPPTQPAPSRSSQGNTMNHASERSGQTARPADAVPALRIRYGRLALAVAGLTALIAVPVTLVLLVAGTAPWWVPVAAGGLLAADVAALRLLAVRDRRRRVQRAFRDAMAAPAQAAPAPLPEPARPAAPEPAEPFDAQQFEQPPAPRLTAEELRTAALAEAVRSGALAPRPAETPWQPVELPRPSYVDAPKAERPEPAPLELPEAPRPAGRTTLRGPAPADTAAGISAAPDAGPSGPAGRDPQEAQPMTGILNLDDVLQRRRA